MDSLLERLTKIIESNEKCPDTFLSILGRGYDEDLISRIIVYTLKNDIGIIKKLLTKYFGDRISAVDFDSCDIFVYPEYTMGSGRADIFVEVSTGDEIIATLTIENKIYTEEHGTSTHKFQTQTYYDWVTQQKCYKNSYNTFYYLKPGFNTSVAGCDRFINITYDDFYGMIEVEDHIINDFKNHIKARLGGENMNLSENQIFLIDNRNKIKNALNDATKLYKEKQNLLLDRIEAEAKRNIPDVMAERVGEGIGFGSFRLYRSQWKVPDKYYFYVEIRFDGGRPDKISYQNTIYNEGKCIDGFLESIRDIINFNDGLYYVWDKKLFKSVYHWADSRWDEEFIKESVEIMADYIKDADRMFERFLNHTAE